MILFSIIFFCPVLALWPMNTINKSGRFPLMQGNYRWSILSPSMGTLEEETNSKTGRGFWSSEMRMQGPALTWCLPEAPYLVSERIWTQAGLRNLRFSGKIPGIYSNLDHLRFPTSYHGNVPTLSRYLNLTNARKGLSSSGFLMMYSLESAVKAWMTSVEWTLMVNSMWWLALKNLEELESCFCSQVVSAMDWAGSLGSFSLSQCHIFKAKVTLQ